MKHFLAIALGLLFLSTPAFSQYKVEVRNLSGVLTHGGEFVTSLAAEQWIAEQEPQNVWGQLERVKPTSECSPDELANQVLETLPAEGEVGSPGYLPERKRLKKTFSTLIVDISGQRAMEAALAKAEKAMNCGRSVQALLLVRNAVKNLSTAQIKQLVEAYSPIKSLLDTGSLSSAGEEIQAVEADGVIITEADKLALLAKINDCRP